MPQDSGHALNCYLIKFVVQIEATTRKIHYYKYIIKIGLELTFLHTFFYYNHVLLLCVYMQINDQIKLSSFFRSHHSFHKF